MSGFLDSFRQGFNQAAAVTVANSYGAPNSILSWNSFNLAKPQTVIDYIRIQRRLNAPLTGRAAQRMRALAAANGPAFTDALQSANVGSQAIGQIGGAFGPMGQAIGMAIGAVGGFVLGILPLQRIEAIERWKRTVEILTPLERFGVLVGSYPLVRAALRKENAEPQPAAFRWGTNPLLGHTALGGPVANTVFMFEAMWEVGDVVPEFENGNSQYEYNLFADWLIAFVAGFHDNDNRLYDMRHAFPLLQSGRISKSLAPRLAKLGNARIGDIRTGLRAVGVTSLWNPPVITTLRKELDRA